MAFFVKFKTFSAAMVQTTPGPRQLLYVIQQCIEMYCECLNLIFFPGDTLGFIPVAGNGKE